MTERWVNADHVHESVATLVKIHGGDRVRATLYAIAPPDMDGPGPVGARHPAVSHKAAQLGREGQRVDVLRCVGWSPYGRTAAEAAERLVLGRGTMAARFGELRKLGLIRRELDGEGRYVTRKLPDDRAPSIVHKITDAGLAALRALNNEAADGGTQ